MFYCNPDFPLIGTSNRVCLFNGHWSTNQPKYDRNFYYLFIKLNLFLKLVINF